MHLGSLFYCPTPITLPLPSSCAKHQMHARCTCTQGRPSNRCPTPWVAQLVAESSNSSPLFHNSRIVHSLVLTGKTHMNLIGLLILGQNPRCGAPIHPQRGPALRTCALFCTSNEAWQRWDTADHADGVTSPCMVFRIETNSMLCLPPSSESHPSPPPSSPPPSLLWSRLILGANLSTHESEPRGKTGIVETVTAPKKKRCLLKPP